MTCDRCDQPIAGTAADPICITGLGTHHYACMQASWRDHNRAEEARQEATMERRSAAQKARRTRPESGPAPEKV